MWVSTFVKEHPRQVFYPDEMAKAIADAFELAQLDVMGNSLSESFDAQGSGTTAACIVPGAGSGGSRRCAVADASDFL